jgi:hypothetical protein
VILDYCPELLKTIVGHAHKQLYDIVMKHIKGTLKRLKGEMDSEYVNQWEWADKMETPAELPNLAEFLDDNPEAKYRKLMAQLKTCREASSWGLSFVWRLAGSPRTRSSRPKSLKKHPRVARR